jgi:hypothetical protein
MKQPRTVSSESQAVQPPALGQRAMLAMFQIVQSPIVTQRMPGKEKPPVVALASEALS